MPPYLLDANFFIEAHRKSYPLDVFPSYWDKIKMLATDGYICSLDKVKAELYKNNDALKTWCNMHLPDNFFKNSDEAILDYAQVVNWAYSKLSHPYTQSALDLFMQADEADAFLVAFAKKHQLVLVTNEISAPDSRKNIKIPDACLPFGVHSIPPIQMLRDLSISI
jgi:Domain of unknown function (DUF4411)